MRSRRLDDGGAFAIRLDAITAKLYGVVLTA
jgi:hypothetical protein